MRHPRNSRRRASARPVLMESLEQRQLMSGTGLTAEYFAGLSFSQPLLTRIDPTVDFKWWYGSPDASVPVDNFSARWTGAVQAPTSETYTFTTAVDDGVRLWVGGNLLIDRWDDWNAVTHGRWEAQMTLEAGKTYEIRMEYYEHSDKAKARLLWSTPSIARQVVPQAMLYSTLLLGTLSANAVAFDAPIVITRGGTYTGNWQSDDPNVPVILVRTADPVIIENANLRGRGNLIVSGMDHTDITVRNTRGWGLNPDVAGKSAGRFVSTEFFDNLVVQNCYMEGTAGIYANRYRGDFSAGKALKVLNNRARNIDGRRSDGQGGYLDFNTRTSLSDGHSEDGFSIVQFVQLNNVQQLPGIEIAGNVVINDPGASRVEDNISIFLSSGTAASPILIHDNFIQGAYTIKPWQTDTADSQWKYDWSYSGGGIMLADGSSNTVAGAAGYVKCYGNTVLDTTNYGIAISAGHDIDFYNNRILSSGTLPDGRAIAAQNVGAYIWDCHNNRKLSVPTFFNNSGHDNVIEWLKGAGRNDWWVPNAASWANNVAWNAPLNADAFANELLTWQKRRADAGIVPGPG